MMLIFLLLILILIPLLQNQFWMIFGKFWQIEDTKYYIKKLNDILGIFFAFVGYIPLILLTLYRSKDTSKLWKISSIVFFIFVAVFLCFSCASSPSYPIGRNESIFYVQPLAGYITHIAS